MLQEAGVKNVSEVIAVIGGTGFIGQHLIKALAAHGQVGSVRVLSRSGRAEMFSGLESVKVVKGNLFSEDSLAELCAGAHRVVNLAYLSDGNRQDNLAFVDNIISACGKNEIHRLLHVSTAVVAGRAKGRIVSELDHAKPCNEYEETKLLIEEKILDSSLGTCDRVILRPTAVFGEGGKNLLKLANDLKNRSLISNYLKSCLYGRRSMNLVCVENVVSALVFLLFRDRDLNGEVFIVSDDRAKGNNYMAVEKILIETLGAPRYPIPQIKIPTFLLKLALLAMGKTGGDVRRTYSDGKLETEGWKGTSDFENKVRDFAVWFKSANH